MKIAIAALFLVAIVSSQVMVTSATSWMRFANCLRRGLGSSALADGNVLCAARQMAWAYTRMHWHGCQNCDKYFHCKGNYNAVENCGSRCCSEAFRAAEVISNCREFSQGGMDADGSADDEANRHGRYGGNCEDRYLCNVNCKFNPSDNTCLRSNC